MIKYTERLYAALENQLNEVAANTTSSADTYSQSITLCKKAMAKLKSYISTYSFQDKREEINFFKYIKPKFYSRYIYYINVFNYIMKMPLGAEETLRIYINSELTDLKRFFDHNQAFYQYYRSGSLLMDEVYFSRGGFGVHVELEDFEEDEIYSTSHDYKLSKIIANERFLEYLNYELQKLVAPDEKFPEPTIELPLTWTSNKTDLVELIYALVSLGVFNNGNNEIKSVVDFFQAAFHVDLGSYYHKYADITKRKKERTPFLDKLKLALLRKIEEKLDEEISQQHRIHF